MVLIFLVFIVWFCGVILVVGIVCGGGERLAFIEFFCGWLVVLIVVCGSWVGILVFYEELLLFR